MQTLKPGAITGAWHWHCR